MTSVGSKRRVWRIANVVVKFKLHVRRPMRPILFRLCRLEKDDFDRGGGDRIGAILMAREARG